MGVYLTFQYKTIGMSMSLNTLSTRVLAPSFQVDIFVHVHGSISVNIHWSVHKFVLLVLWNSIIYNTKRIARTQILMHISILARVSQSLYPIDETTILFLNRILKSHYRTSVKIQKLFHWTHELHEFCSNFCLQIIQKNTKIGTLSASSFSFVANMFQR